MMKIFSLSLAVITALDAGEMDSLATELENDRKSNNDFLLVAARNVQNE